MVFMATKKVPYKNHSINLTSRLCSAHKCLKCDDACETCSGGGKNECLTCRQQDNAQLENGSCVTG